MAERTVAVGDMLRQPENMDPVVHGIVASGERFSAVEAFKAEYLRAELARQIQQTLASFDALVVPTSPTIHTREAMKQEPVRYNSQLGVYTNFTNLADLSALALPAFPHGWFACGNYVDCARTARPCISELRLALAGTAGAYAGGNRKNAACRTGYLAAFRITRSSCRRRCAPDGHAVEPSVDPP